MSASKDTSSDVLESLYDKIANDEEGRACKDISDDACKVVPGNFFKIMGANTLTKIGDELASAKTTLPWLLQAVGAPGFFIGFLVPIRESGSLLPQLFLASFIRGKPIRKWFWVGGSIIQGLMLIGIALAGLMLEGMIAGLVVTGLLLLFALARAMCSLSSKDILGKTIPKHRRGRLKGWMSAIAGVVSTIIGLGFFLSDDLDGATGIIALLLSTVGVVWIIAALLFAQVKEFPGETTGGKNAGALGLSKLGLLRSDKAFRDFVIARTLALCSALSAPYFVVLGQQHSDAGAGLLGAFIAANGIAAMLSGPMLGKWADSSSRRVLQFSVFLASAIGLLLLSLVWASEDIASQVWLYPLAFFILGIAHNGVRLGRKTYLVDMAGNSDERTTYVAVSNTLIGIFLLIVGGLGSLVSLIGVEIALLMLSLLGIAGAIYCQRLPEVE